MISLDLLGLDSINNDPRRWLPESSPINLNIIVNVGVIAIGSYDMYLALADPLSPKVFGYSIRFANLNMWQPATGLNNLNHSL